MRTIASPRLIFNSIIALILLFASNMLVRNLAYDLRVDATEQKLYSLSDATTTLLHNLKEPITIRVFFSERAAKDLPIFQAYAVRVRNLLAQSVERTRGMLKVEFLNPEPFTESEDLAMTHGLEGIPMDTAGTKFYFGMSVENSTDQRGVMPFLDPAREQFLEYDVMRLITEMAQPRRKKIAIISGLPMRGGLSGERGITVTQQAFTPPWAIYEQVDEAFDVQVIDKHATSFDTDVDAVWVVHPVGFTKELTYALDQYLLAGGKALIMLDSKAKISTLEQKHSSLEPLLSHWGIKFSEGFVAADSHAAIQVEAMDASSKLLTYPNVTWLDLKGSDFSDDSVITASLEHVRMIESGFFTRDDNASVVLEPLIHTSVNAMQASVADAEKESETLSIYRNYTSQNKPLVLAAQLNGIVDSAFARESLSKDQQKKHLARSEHPIHLIVVGDVDMLQNDYWAKTQEFSGKNLIMPTADNGAFILNSLEYLTGEGALINLRTRHSKNRTFAVLDTMKREAEQRYRTKEHELKEQLVDMETRIHELQGIEKQQNDSNALFTAEQQKEISRFREIFLATRTQLRAVQHQLEQEIEALGTRLAWINILSVPCLLFIASFIVPARLRKIRNRKGVAR
ncbi:MAG: hypothetical protein EAY65_01140 [Alphaproteobacteria bacterium]|nr:MAG: hypothetical protein EAY65_01140 [Alphaproteobacteria bacterium]